MAKSKEKIPQGNYKNPNGEMSIEDMIKLKYSGKVDEFLRNFKVTQNPCPSNKLKPKNNICFHCVLECWIPALNEIKEYKNYYLVKGKKYIKEEFDSEN